ncbi:hypothetical protein [Falsiroseomonas oryzae]|uniref:hypothetical protein n=1 Tax=Falsiroseomonas oryzae TaxID=2766473 RepID=UPI0022EABC8D|nr:hypothetical protein [Roseomonas sp. MO-31]
MSFTTVREESFGKHTLRAVRLNAGGYRGIVLKYGGGRLGPFDATDLDELWDRLKLEAMKAGRAYVGFDGARARFLNHFPRGFEDPGYLKDERNYKLDAKRKLDTTAPLDAAATDAGFGPAVLTVFHGTNLLSPFEKTKLTPLLRGPSADAFVRAAAAFTLGAGDPALQELRRIAHPFESAKWTVLTYLPFLWRPDAHMFLKPTVTQDFAERVGHSFAQAYAPELDIGIYESLLDLVRRTETELAQLGPRDRIDVQSFIWVVGSYEDAPGTGDPNSR